MYEKYCYPTAVANGAGPEVPYGRLPNPMRNFHRATIVPKSQFQRFRTHKSRFGTGVDVVWGVKPAKKKGPRGGRVYVHAINFDRKRFSPRQAKSWLKAHGFKAIEFSEAKPKLEIPKRKPKKKVAAAAANVMPEGVVYKYVAAAMGNPVAGPKTINEAIKIARQHAPSPYARAYADSAMTASTMYGIRGLQVQILYLLNNLNSWRGPLARETKKFMRAWAKSQEAMKNPELMTMSNPAVPARKLPPKAKVAAKHRGITGLPEGAWTSWSDMRLANHFLALVPTYGPAMVNNWIKNIERWSTTSNSKLSAKARRVRKLVEGSPRYKKHLGRPRGSWKTPNPATACRMCGIALENPQLMILSNPTSTTKKPDVARVRRAYKRFHFTEPAKTTKGKVPDGWPRQYAVLGLVDRFDVKDAKGKVHSKKFSGPARPNLCTDEKMKNVYIFSKNGPVGVPAGNAERVDYTVPPHSGRTKWARRWWHAQDSHPPVKVAENGRAIKMSGPGLSVTPRGIVG